MVKVNKRKEINMIELNAYFKSDGFSVDLSPEGIGNSEVVDGNLGEWFERFIENKVKALFYIGFQPKAEYLSSSMTYLHRISELLLKRLSMQPDIEFTREEVELELMAEDLSRLKAEIPFALGMEFVDSAWINHLWNELLEVFKAEIKDYEGSVSNFFSEHHSNINVVGRIFFHLVESKNADFPFAFMATYSTKPIKSKKAIHTPLKHALVEFHEDEKKLISLLITVTKAAELSNFIGDLFESGELFSPLKLTADEAHTFLKEISIYESVGIMCRVPDWWRKRSNRMKISVTVGEKTPSKLGLNAIMDFSPQILLGNEKLTQKELKSFLSMADGLVQYKGKWVEVNKEKLEAVLEAFEKVKGFSGSEEFTLGEAMRMELNINKALDISSDDLEISISNGKWLKNLKEMLLDPSSINRVDLSPDFHAILRAYQETGYQWLCTMSNLGFGACLADDMGLGKTIQILAFLEYVRNNHGGRVLLVLPASLIGNWQKEIEKFTPNLTYQILHKSAGKSSEEIQIDPKAFLSITTYGMVSRLTKLQDIEWDFLILDEAQAIKNPGTKQTKQIKMIPAKMRIAMTGTPIENRLGDLWSLFDFLNKGLLGSAKEFTEFTKGLSDNTQGYAKLRKMINPFILRRLKTDRSIIQDLPDKVEIIEYASLSTKQIALYKKLIDQIRQQLEEAEGIGRKGVVLSSIMKFKQICNHPDHYLGREEFKEEHSGKFGQLSEICKTIYEKRERVLVFTQFREMTEPLSEFLKEIFHQEGFVLHGGTSIKNRNEMVEKFNGEGYVPYMVLSLKAGGVGLNLTSANHVVHFDRWWNPAVENQATDRAFRIGQTKNVMVHKFVTKGTIEEKIDEMIKDKQQLAGDILSASGEQWITEYSNDELMQLFTLDGDLS